MRLAARNGIKVKRPRKARDAAGRILEPSEHKIQVRLLDYLAYAARADIYYFAIPNQSNRHIQNAVKMKAEGVRSGIADLCFMFPQGRVGWLEMKKPGGTLSDNQKNFRDICKALSHDWAIAKSVDEALAILTKWDALKPAYRKQSTLFNTNHLESIKLKPIKPINQASSKGEVSHGTQT